jgi:hypothetical protein
MPVEHAILKQQSAFDTWVTPDIAIPIDKWTVDPGIEKNNRRLTGSNRALARRWRGKKQPKGNFDLPMVWENMGWILKAAGLNGVTSTRLIPTTGLAYEHGFIPNDAAVPAGLSVQLKRDATHAQNLLGVLINTLKIACTAGEEVKLSGDWVAKDEAPSGGYWDYDKAVAAPAVITTPTYSSPLVGALDFVEATVNIGGTLTYNPSTKTFTVVGGASAIIEMIEVTLTNNWDARVFLGNRTPKNAVGGDREVTCRFTLDQSTTTETFYGYWRAGTTGAIVLKFIGPNIETTNFYTGEIVLPLVDYGPAPLPDISGSQERRTQSVEATALQSSFADLDIAARIIDKQASYA